MYMYILTNFAKKIIPRYCFQLTYLCLSVLFICFVYRDSVHNERVHQWPFSLPLAIYTHYPLANEVAKGYSNATVRPSVTPLWTL